MLYRWEINIVMYYPTQNNSYNVFSLDYGQHEIPWTSANIQMNVGYFSQVILTAYFIDIWSYSSYKQYPHLQVW